MLDTVYLWIRQIAVFTVICFLVLYLFDGKNRKMLCKTTNIKRNYVKTQQKFQKNSQRKRADFSMRRLGRIIDMSLLGGLY